MSGFPPSPEIVARTKENYPKGSRVMLVRTSDPHTDLKPTDQGTVDMVDDAGHVAITWDNGSKLSMIPGEDLFYIMEE